MHVLIKTLEILGLKREDRAKIYMWYIGKEITLKLLRLDQIIKGLLQIKRRERENLL